MLLQDLQVEEDLQASLYLLLVLQPTLVQHPATFNQPPVLRTTAPRHAASRSAGPPIEETPQKHRGRATYVFRIFSLEDHPEEVTGRDAWEAPLGPEDVHPWPWPRFEEPKVSLKRTHTGRVSKGENAPFICFEKVRSWDFVQ